MAIMVGMVAEAVHRGALTKAPITIMAAMVMGTTAAMEMVADLAATLTATRTAGMAVGMAVGMAALTATRTTRLQLA